MKLIVFFLLFFSHFTFQGQGSFYSLFPMGNYGIGYYDPLIYNDSLLYDQYGYSGPAPMFIQVWYPVEKPSTTKTLNFNDLRKRDIPNNLRRVYEELVVQLDASFISYNLKEAFLTYDEIDYDPYSDEEVLSRLKEYPIQSRYNQLDQKLDFPVIIYHHGSQGFSDENFIMAEYFASRGYIFVSANFHLPYAGSVYGLYESVRNNPSAVKAVIAFAKTLTTSDHLFFVGHSWGAQVGWTFLYENGWVTAFVSMETTLEFKTDTTEIKDKWPFVYEIVKTRQEQFGIPILLLANTREDKSFWFFENSGTNEMIFASAREEFGHESYTSAYLLRYFYREQFKQPDANLLVDQIRLYVEHLRLMDSFFNSVTGGEPFSKDPFSDSFFINIKPGLKK